DRRHEGPPPRDYARKRKLCQPSIVASQRPRCLAPTAEESAAAHSAAARNDAFPFSPSVSQRPHFYRGTCFPCRVDARSAGADFRRLTLLLTGPPPHTQR